MDLTVVIPVYNEKGVIDEFLPRLYKELTFVSGVTTNFVIVDDGSTDGTYQALKKIAAEYSDVKTVRLFRNCGHQHALIEGLRHAKPGAVLMLDGDGQHPAAVARCLVNHLVDNPECDIVQAVRAGGQAGAKDKTSRFFYTAVRKLIPNIVIESGESDFRIISSEIVRLILSSRHGQRNLRVFLGMLTVNKIRVSYEAAERWGGSSKYSFRKMVRLAVDGLFGFSYVPLRVSHWISALLGVVSFACLVQAFVVWIRGGTVPGWTSIVGVLCLCFCGVFAVLAIQSEYLIMIYESLSETGSPDLSEDKEH